MDKSELYGTLVLIHPDLRDDPARKQGKVGVLTYVDAGNEAFVSFLDKTEGHYKPEALLRLKGRDELFSTIDDPASMSLSDYKDLYKIGLLQDLGRSTDMLQSLEIAGNNPAIWDRSLVNVAELMAPKPEHSFSR